MKKWRVVATALLAVVLLAGLAVGGVALAQSQTQPTPTPTTTSSGTPWIGVTLVDLNEKLAARIGVSQTTGVVVSMVVPSSPAAEAGLKVKDLIKSVDGNTVTKAEEVVAAIKAKKIGDVVALTVTRDGTDQSITVKTAEMPQPVQRGVLGGGRFFGIGPRGGWSGFGAPFGKLMDGLRDLAPSDLFGHMLGSQFRFLDKDNKPVTVKAIPGTVVSASKDSLTIKPNDPAESGGPYAITSDTKVLLPNRAGAESLKAGDQVVVTTADGKTALTVTSGIGGKGPGRAGGWTDGVKGLRGHWGGKLAPGAQPTPGANTPTSATN